MANNDNRNINIGKPAGVTGAAFRSPLGTAVPTNETTAKNVLFKNVGYLSDAGVVRAIGETSTSIKAWGGSIVRKVSSDHDVTYQFTMLETLNPEAAKTFYGDSNVTTTAGTGSTSTKTAIVVKANVSQKNAWIFELADSPAIGRIVVPNGEVTARGDVSWVDTATVAYSVTVTAYEDSAGNKAYEYWDNGIIGIPAA